VKAVRALLNKNTKIMAVVKADAYGHGMIPVAGAAIRAGADWLAVAMPEEAQNLRESGFDCPILVMGKSNGAQKKLAIELGLTNSVSSQDEIEEFAAMSREIGKPALLHVKVDTGMGRIGVRNLNDFDKMLCVFREHTNAHFDGIFTHFACSDLQDKSFTMRQDDVFKTYIRRAEEGGFSPMAHASSSAAVIDLPEMNYDAIRLGISLYGYYPSEYVKRERLDLKPVMRVVTEISHIKKIAAGDTVGYGATYTASKDTQVATLPIGYGDGYSRLLSNKGRVIVIVDGHPYYAKVIGRVCMDQIMVDVSGIENVACKDTVVVMGRAGDKKVDADEIAAMTGTISYEVLLSYSKRVPRLYVE
jgi:alanine racemase